MKIAITANGQSLTSKVAKSFEFCKYLLIVETDDFKILDVIKNDKDDRGDFIANEILKYDCEAVITGDFNTPAFFTVADAQVTRYFGTGHAVKESIDLMDSYSLNIIRNPEGTEDCDGDHEHDSNMCHDHDHDHDEEEDCTGDCSSCSSHCN